jgi:hypothetical protein
VLRRQHRAQVAEPDLLVRANRDPVLGKWIDDAPRGARIREDDLMQEAADHCRSDSAMLQ